MTPFYEIWEYQDDGLVRRIAMCGTEDDARMMMLLGRQRSWIKCEFSTYLYYQDDHS